MAPLGSGMGGIVGTSDDKNARGVNAVIGRAYQFGDYANLDDEHRPVVFTYVKFLERLVKPFDAVQIYYERTLPVKDHSTQYIMERHVTPDVVVLVPAMGLALVVDFKTGRAEWDYDASHDLQLLTYAMAVRNHYEGVFAVHAYRFHPRLWNELQQTSVSYGGDLAEWSQREES